MPASKRAFGITLLVVGASIAGPGGCGSDESGAGGNDANRADGGTNGPVCTDCTPVGPMTFRLPSPAGATLWTTTTMDKVVREAVPPENTGDAIQIYAAKNEFEPFQIVVRADASTNVTLAMPPLSGPGTIPRIELRRVGYVNITQPSDASSIKSGFVPDPLEPAAFGAPAAVTGGENQPFWITVYVPPDTPAGDYTSTLTVTVGGVAQAVPIKLHVYDFALPKKIGFDGNWNLSFQALGGSESLAAVEKLKTWLYEHRIVPSSVAWPAGLNYNGGIEYDCASGTFKEEANDYDFSRLGPKYVGGVGWNGEGFPSFEAMHFVDNATPRPQTFCGVDRGPDHFGTPQYNAAWSKLLSAIDAYLVAKDWTGKGYYYVQNEPQGPDDYDVAAHLASLTKAAAPHLRIAISEEPKPEIAENPRANGKSYDLWWADLALRAELREDAAGEGRGRVVVLPLRRPAAALQSDRDRSLWRRVTRRVLRRVEVPHQGLCVLLRHRLGCGSVREPAARGDRHERRRVPALSAEERRAREQHPLGAPSRGRRGLRVPLEARWRHDAEDPRRGGRLRPERDERGLVADGVDTRHVRAAASPEPARAAHRREGERLPGARVERRVRPEARRLLDQLPGSRRASPRPIRSSSTATPG